MASPPSPGRRLLALGLFLLWNAPIFGLLILLPFMPEGTGAVGAALFNGALFLLFAVPHSLLARPSIQRPLDRRLSPPWRRVLYLTGSSLSLGLLLLLWRPLEGVLWSVDGWPGHVITAIYIVFIILELVTACQVNYFAFLGGSLILEWPQEETPELTREGVYGLCRHPMYVILALLFWIGPTMTVTRAELALCATIYIAVGTVLEERTMLEQHGQAYRDYCRAVPRWVPRLRKKKLRSRP